MPSILKEVQTHTPTQKQRERERHYYTHRYPHTLIHLRILSILKVRFIQYFFFSFDVRGRSFNKALQWSDPGNFGPRAYFATVARPAALTLSSVQLDDEGTYRCRVDFKNSPTRNFQIRLTVIGEKLLPLLCKFKYQSPPNGKLPTPDMLLITIAHHINVFRQDNKLRVSRLFNVVIPE